jgi:hypothetical protein
MADGPHVEGKAKIFVNGKEIAWILVRLSRKVVQAAEERHLQQLLYTVGRTGGRAASAACSRRSIS